MHDLAFIRYPQFYKPIDRLLYRKKYGASARHADHVITVSDQTRVMSSISSALRRSV